MLLARSFPFAVRGARGRLPLLRCLSSAPSEASLDHRKLQVERRSDPQPKPANKDLVFGRTPTDHMLTAEWNAGEGWLAPRVQPYANLSLPPSALVFHYALECFEGMKAYKDKDKNIRLFRPLDNMHRMNASSERVSLPGFDSEEYLECIKELLRVDRDWIPEERGYSLYIRPTHIGTQGVLGVQPSSKSLLYTICCPVGPYYKSGFEAVSLYADDKNVRAWKGGSGQYKIGGNYGPAIGVSRSAVAKGYQQVLWLYNDLVTEVGTMNFFVLWELPGGEKELITAPLDGTILPGVTRASVIDLVRDWGGIKVSEREFSIHDVLQAQQEGRLLEAFGCGTACIISPVKLLSYKGQDYQVPLDPDDASAKAGPLARKLNDTILAIQYGELESPWSMVV